MFSRRTIFCPPFFLKKKTSLLVVYSLALVSAAGRDDKQFSIFNVIKFPNEVCASASSLNGTCYTATECTSLGGSSSGSCASGFGVCCVFSIACGATTSQNNTYATITSFNTATDADPCLYTYCKNNDDICKLRWVFNPSTSFSRPSLLILPPLDLVAIVIPMISMIGRQCQYYLLIRQFLNQTKLHIAHPSP